MSRTRARLVRHRRGPRRDVYLLAVPDTPASLALLHPWLRPADRRAAGAMSHAGRRRAQLIARALLRRALAERGHPRARLRLRRNRRPLHDDIDRRRCSLTISHGGGWVMVGLAPGAAAGRRIGVDLEARGRTLRPGLAARLPWGVATPAGWTATEAALKADGHGLPALADLAAIGGRGLVRRLRMRRSPYHRLTVWGMPGPTSGQVAALAIALPGAPQLPRR